MANYIEIYTTHVQRGINDIQHRQYFMMDRIPEKRYHLQKKNTYKS